MPKALLSNEAVLFNFQMPYSSYYNDDIEVANSLMAKAGLHKLGNNIHTIITIM